MKRGKKCGMWMIPLLAGLAAAFLAGAGPSEKEKELQEELAGKVLRLRVLANSDSSQDQEEKLRVRDKVLEYLEPLLADSGSLEESCRIVEAHLDQVEAAAGEILEREDSGRQVQAALSTEWFPLRVYGRYTFPEGEYRTLKVTVGDGEGHNWWCVLYPGLCFADAVHPVTEEQEETKEADSRLGQILPEEVYDFIRYPARTKIRFLWF